MWCYKELLYQFNALDIELQLESPIKLSVTENKDDNAKLFSNGISRYCKKNKFVYKVNLI